MKIIVADDHALFREGLRHVLIQLDKHVEFIEAADHASALQLAAQHPDADLVLLDLGMPGCEPIAAIKALIAQCSTTPVVVLSGSDDLVDVRRVLDAGAMGFIPKSENVGVMLSALRLVLAGGIYMPPMLMKKNSGMASKENVSSLTPRQLDVLLRLAAGKSNKEIGREMGLSESTVKVHTVAIYRDLNVSNRIDAVRMATERGLLTSNPISSC